MSLDASMLFRNHCAGCGKPIGTPAISRRGDLPTVYCDGVCETIAKRKERMYKGQVNSDRTIPKRVDIKFPKSRNEEIMDTINRYGTGPTSI